jgi:hypothetical protein
MTDNDDEIAHHVHQQDVDPELGVVHAHRKANLDAVTVVGIIDDGVEAILGIA